MQRLVVKKTCLGPLFSQALNDESLEMALIDCLIESAYKSVLTMCHYPNYGSRKAPEKKSNYKNCVGHRTRAFILPVLKFTEWSNQVDAKNGYQFYFFFRSNTKATLHNHMTRWMGGENGKLHSGNKI